MKKSLLVILTLALLMSTTGCYVHTHTIGQPSTNEVEKYHQWFLFWGFYPVEPKDGGALAGKKDVKITTKFDWDDSLITFFILLGLVGRRTIVIEK